MFSRVQLQSILDTLPDPAFILTADGTYAALFGGLDQRYYHDGRGLIGRKVSDVLPPDKARFFLEQITQALQSRTMHVVEYGLGGSDVDGLAEDGPDGFLWFEGRVQALDFPVDGQPAVLWIASNITEKHQIQAELRQKSETDALTGLFNRRKLVEALEEYYQLFTRRAVPTAVLLFDIDHFKQINDRLGHAAGDEALLTVAGACRCELRKQDLIARVGGDEFVVVMPSTDIFQSQALAERLRRNISGALLVTLKQPSTISGGLSQFSPPDRDSAEILRRADTGMYQAKKQGRDRIALC